MAETQLMTSAPWGRSIILSQERAEHFTQELDQCKDMNHVLYWLLNLLAYTKLMLILPSKPPTLDHEETLDFLF
jgi:hypothetical protein